MSQKGVFRTIQKIGGLNERSETHDQRQCVLGSVQGQKVPS